MEYLFVYGTLLKDFKHTARLPIEEHLQFISKATIKGALYDLGNYPGYVEEPFGEVKGELYRIDKIDRVFEILDKYEGLFDDEPEYIRRRKTIELPDGEKVESWIYIFQQQLRPEHKRIIDGDYIAYVNKG
ncbi:gamma-glutamylcyclotransferase family protein [Mucilaginibacter jinjuensis]|uniref:Gamma-glutamylcyclotransferase n=1 Tax=Mucilaginibacter jinjuensis TaxID=1176721 RepID=A0ABY7T985_9SPHI|nr:gamma-glutamylcyclotransferase family protein [Mucilaginibacter jinjuensis]WCT12774.1 gamma-glutamylcyclotransferase [Mucilaginibacter jinjuensis]